eukprot:1354526-Pleurochrysis_carterae.AAC.1
MSKVGHDIDKQYRRCNQADVSVDHRQGDQQNTTFNPRVHHDTCLHEKIGKAFTHTDAHSHRTHTKLQLILKPGLWRPATAVLHAHTINANSQRWKGAKKRAPAAWPSPCAASRRAEI